MLSVGLLNQHSFLEWAWVKDGGSFLTTSSEVIYFRIKRKGKNTYSIDSRDTIHQIQWKEVLEGTEADVIDYFRKGAV